MVRLVAYLLTIALIASGLAWLADRPGTLQIVWQGYDIETSVFRAVVLFAAAIAYYILQRIIFAQHGERSKLAKSIGWDYKGKLSPVFYAIGIATAFIRPWISCAIYLGVALMWLIPDRRIERVVEE